MDWKLELVVVPVSDQDRAKAFYTEKAGFQLDVDHRADDLGNASDGLSHGFFLLSYSGFRHSASAPEMISINSLVIIAWRVRL